uniref:Uncharacterized protein n=1 Tax=Arundo donax TaxID=35708 RepID=A0A0A8YIP6_ARUDO
MGSDGMPARIRSYFLSLKKQ